MAGTVALLTLGAVLRAVLCWANPADNSFDDFFEPIFLLLRNGSLPSKYACWECFQPPVLYVLAGAAAKPLTPASPFLVMAALNWMNCAVGVATLVLGQRVVARLPLGDFGRILALAVMCLLPRHIYMSAMFTNDGLATFFSVAAVLFMLRALQSRHWVDLVGVAATASLAIFTKHTALPLLPMLLVALWLAGRSMWTRGAVAVAVPVALLLVSMTLNYREYGAALPNNSSLSALVPRGESGRADLLTFTPWQFVRRPVIGAGQLSSVWTVTNASMWFDTEGRFLMLLGDRDWWDQRYADMVAGRPTPASIPAAAARALWLGSVLQLVGLTALAMAAAGVWAIARKRTDMRVALPLLTVVAASAVMVGLHAQNMPAWHMPTWSSMKASYLLPSMPGAAFLVGLGGDRLGRAGRLVALGVVLVGGLLVTGNVLVIARA